MLIAAGAIAVLLILVLSASVRVAREYERGVIFRLGRLLSPPKGPGLFLLIPVIDKMVRVDLRTVTLNVPPQEVITKDNVPVRVNAVAYFRIIDPEKAIVQVENYMVATSQIAQTTLRSVLGQHQLDELLSERDKINEILQRIIDEATSPWGIKVSIVEVKDVEIPSGMQRAMARQAEAERERRAKVIAAEGEFQASERLKDAAQVLSENPMSLQLRYLQTMLEMSSERTSTLILPLPIELIGPMLGRREETTEQRAAPRPALGQDRGDRARPGTAAGSVPRRDRGSDARGARVLSVLCRARGPHAAAGARAARSTGSGRCGSCRTSTQPSSARRSSSTRRATCARSPKLEDAELDLVADAWRRRFAAAGERGFPVRARDDQRGPLRRREPGALAFAADLAARAAPRRRAGAGRWRTAPSAGWSASRSARRRRQGEIAAICHPAGRAPFELLIAPRTHDPEAADDLGGALQLLRDSVRRLRKLEGPVPWNAWLHQGAHWHLEVVPRLTVFAGLELGAEIYVNVVAPESAAEALRSAL